jgi:hypothetical protein
MRSREKVTIATLFSILQLLGCGPDNRVRQDPQSVAVNTTPSDEGADIEQVKTAWKQLCEAMAQRDEGAISALTTDSGLKSLKSSVPADRDVKEVFSICGQSWSHFPLRIAESVPNRVSATFGKEGNEGTVIFVAFRGKWALDRFIAGD